MPVKARAPESRVLGTTNSAMPSTKQQKKAILSDDLFVSAGSETRTRMPVKAHAPETCASTNSAIPAVVFFQKRVQR
jgi:hypothetical protein